MEAVVSVSCFFCSGVCSTSSAFKSCFGLHFGYSYGFGAVSGDFRRQRLPFLVYNNSNTSSTKTSGSGVKRRIRGDGGGKRRILLKTVTPTKSDDSSSAKWENKEEEEEEEKTEKSENRLVNVRTLYQNGDPLGRRELGRCVVRWISQGMRGMAADFASAELQAEFAELKQRMGPGLTFVIQAQPYLNAIPMPLGQEAICLKACTHYPTLFDHFQRELRDVLQEYQRKSQFEDWRETQSWKLLKELANSGIRAFLCLLVNFSEE